MEPVLNCFCFQENERDSVSGNSKMTSAAEARAGADAAHDDLVSSASGRVALSWQAECRRHALIFFLADAAAGIPRAKGGVIVSWLCLTRFSRFLLGGKPSIY
jgi:hypothetical protein